jgi:hypothetical protein
MPVVLGHLLEILALERARLTMEGPQNGQPVCILTLRPDPETNLAPAILMLNQEQCVRLRDTLNDFLNQKDSWLYLSKAKQQKLRRQEC